MLKANTQFQVRKVHQVLFHQRRCISLFHLCSGALWQEKCPPPLKQPQCLCVYFKHIFLKLEPTYLMSLQTLSSQLQFKTRSRVFERSLAAQHACVLTGPQLRQMTCFNSRPLAVGSSSRLSLFPPPPPQLPLWLGLSFSSMFWQQRSPALQSPYSRLVPLCCKQHR